MAARVSVFDGASRDELLFAAGVFYLDNRRLRRLVFKLATRYFEMPDCEPFKPEERDDMMLVISEYARQVGADDALMDALGRLTPTGMRRRSPPRRATAGGRATRHEV